MSKTQFFPVSIVNIHIFLKSTYKNNGQMPLCQLRMSIGSNLFSENKIDKMKIAVTETSIITR